MNKKVELNVKIRIQLLISSQLQNWDEWLSHRPSEDSCTRTLHTKVVLDRDYSGHPKICNSHARL
jgi:hypothetical protein